MPACCKSTVWDSNGAAALRGLEDANQYQCYTYDRYNR
jgi:hypothetical protein